MSGPFLPRVLRAPASLQWTLAVLFLLYAIPAITGIAATMPPLQAADELNHAERADQIAHGTIVARRSEDGSEAGGLVDTGLQSLAEPFDPVRFHPKTKVSPSMVAAESANWAGVAPRAFSNTAIYPPLFYLPAALGLRIGRATHLTIWHAVILARLFTGLTSSLIAGTAIGLAEGFAPLLFTLCCLPMSLALFSAISQDGPMIACAALAAVLLARSWSTSGPFWIGCLLLAMVVAARPAYLPLCAVPLCAPGRKWQARYIAASAVFGVTLGWMALCSRITLPYPAATHVADQLAAIRAHPAILDMLLHTTIHKQWIEGFTVGREFIGVLGWLDTTLPNVYYALAGAVMLAALAMSRAPTTQRGGRSLAAMATLISSVIAVYATQYLSWSRVGGAFIDGVQGRYFLPIAPFVILSMPHSGWRYPRPMLIGLCIFPALSILVTARALAIRYYLG